jgi:hypothetical protein
MLPAKRHRGNRDYGGNLRQGKNGGVCSRIPMIDAHSLDGPLNRLP